jgi:hypothetical protein
MAVPTVITDLSTTIASNVPAGSESPASLDDYQRAHAAFIAQLYAGTVAATTVIVASATSTAIGAAASENVDISGTTTITSFDTVAEGINRKGRFTGALTLTHNATSLILPGVENIITAANDRYEARSLGSGNWIVTKYVSAAGAIAAAGLIDNTFTGVQTFAGGTPLVFEGATADAFETSFVITDPTADRTVTFPNADVDLTLVQAASTILAGVSRYSTTAENVAAVNGSSCVTPLGLAEAFSGANQSLATSGYQKLPGGVIIQWGRFTGSASITFPVAFPTACGGVVCTITGGAGSGSSDYTCWPSGIPSTSGFSTNATAANAGMYLAMGY